MNSCASSPTSSAGTCHVRRPRVATRSRPSYVTCPSSSMSTVYDGHRPAHDVRSRRMWISSTGKSSARTMSSFWASAGPAASSSSATAAAMWRTLMLSAFPAPADVSARMSRLRPVGRHGRGAAGVERRDAETINYVRARGRMRTKLQKNVASGGASPATHCMTTCCDGGDPAAENRRAARRAFPAGRQFRPFCAVIYFIATPWKAYWSGISGSTSSASSVSDSCQPR